MRMPDEDEAVSATRSPPAHGEDPPPEASEAPAGETMKMPGRVLVAGVGNIFLGDDGFGVEVARRLADAGLPDWVRVADYGISGMHLAYDMAEGYETTILVDAAPRGGEPGTITVLEVSQEDRQDLAADGDAVQGSRLFDAHGMHPEVVFGVLGMLGAKAGRVLVVGCEPASAGYGIGLSEPVAAAVGEAVRVVTELALAAGEGGDPAAPVSVSQIPASECGPAALSRRPARVTGAGGPAGDPSGYLDNAKPRKEHGALTANGKEVSHVPRHTR